MCVCLCVGVYVCACGGSFKTKLITNNDDNANKQLSAILLLCLAEFVYCDREMG